MDFRVMLESGDDEYPGCFLVLGLGKWRKQIAIPAIVKPGVCMVRGQYNYDEFIESRYGVYLFENHFNICYGRGDANFNRDIFGEEQRWSCFLPWMEWRHVRHSLYDLSGGHVFTQFDRDAAKGVKQYEDFRKQEPICPKRVFTFRDFDGEEIEATTHIEEREWHRGEGWFKWLSWFTPAKIRRSLDIQFNKETGKRKGSWKGGTIGHGIDMQPGELHESAFRRYCVKHGMTFVK